jgi:hypothetical protein
VPHAALRGGLAINSWGGIYEVRFPVFKSWLVDGGPSAQLQALHDARVLDSAIYAGAPRKIWKEQKQTNVPELLVKDVAYQILCGNREIAIRFDYDRAKRDELIDKLLASRYEEPVNDD